MSPFSFSYNQRSKTQRVATNGRPGGAQRDLLALRGARARLGCSATGPAAGFA